MAVSSPNDVNLTQLRWRCRRGMGELDHLLNQFLQRRYESLTSEQRQTFSALLDEEDDQLWDWFLSRGMPEKQAYQELIQLILQSHHT